MFSLRTTSPGHVQYIHHTNCPCPPSTLSQPPGSTQCNLFLSGQYTNLLPISSKHTISLAPCPVCIPYILPMPVSTASHLPLSSQYTIISPINVQSIYHLIHPCSINKYQTTPAKIKSVHDLFHPYPLRTLSLLTMPSVHCTPPVLPTSNQYITSTAKVQ